MPSQQLHAVAHGGEVHHGGYAGEILHQHAGRAEADFRFALAAIVEPGNKGFNVRLLHRAAIFKTQQVLKQHLHRIGQLGDALQAILLCRGDAVISIGLGPYFQGLAAFEGVE